jgi:choline kinase
MDSGTSFICVNTSATAEEEVKYTVNADGYVALLSKTVDNALGESVGINYISAADRANLIAGLEACADTDYFERGIEIAIERVGMKVVPLDISDLFAVEVDFEDDLARANTHL